MKNILKKIFNRFLEEALRNSEIYPNDWRHVADTKSGEFYHMDNFYRIWSCNCKNDASSRISLCLTIDDVLDKEGQVRELNRKINERRKELSFLTSETLEEGYRRLLDQKN